MTRAIQFAGVTLTGLLAGDELGTLIGSPPAIQALPLAGQIEAEQALTGRLAKIMPLYTSGTLLATTGMLLITAVGNIPLNTATMAYPTTGDSLGWAGIRRRWERLHTVRVLLDLTAFGCLAAAALGDRQRPV